MKKLILLTAAIAFGAQAWGQTYFSQGIGGNNSSSFYNSGAGSTRMASGNFVTVTVGDGGGFEVKTFSPSFSLIKTENLTDPAFTIRNIYTVQELSASEVLVTGRGITSGMVNEYFIASLNLSTGAVKSVHRLETFSYTSGPKAVISGTEIFAIFPEFYAAVVHGFDLSLNPTWCDSIGDSTSMKNPSMDIECIDTEIVITCKNDSSLGGGSFSRMGGMNDYIIYRGTGYTRAYGISKTADGSILYAGLHSPIYADPYTSAPLLAKRDLSGTVLWAKKLDEATPGATFSRFLDAIELPDGKIIALASKTEAYSDTYFDGLCIFDASGNLLRAIKLGDDNWSYMMYDIKVYNDGILMSGVATNMVTFEVQNLVSFTDFDLSQICHQSNASLVVTNRDMGTPDHTTSSMFFAPAAFATTHTMPSLAATTSTQPEECSILSGSNTATAAAFTAYPNPVTAGELVAVRMATSGEFTYTVTDMTGKLIRSGNFSGTSGEISTNGLTAGMYLVNLRGAQSMSSHKLIVR